MELKKSIFSRLFGSKAEDTPAEEEESFLPDLPPEPPAAGPTPRHELILPEDHAIFKLWVLRRDGAGWLSKPELCLEGENDPIMPDDEGKKELLRLQPVINASASARYDKARTRTQDGMDIPPSDLDAEVVIFLSRDGLTAWLLAYPPVGLGNDLNIGILKSSLDSFHVTHGVDQELLHALPKDPDRYFHLFVIARGTPMIPGLHGRVVDLFPRVEERKLTVDENNRVDFTELNFIHNVEQGGVICQIFPATEGTPGITVQDQPIPIRPGKPVVIPQGRNTEVSEDGQALIASIAGHVEFSGRGFQVKPVLDIPGNVDFSVGDISFLGDVCVHGDICSGFTVRATGSITVGGVVEACIVEAGRDLVVAQGIQGDSQAIIRAQRNVFAKYLENSCVYAKENIEAECIINCNVYCDGSVQIRAGRGSIIGGQTRSAREINANIVGSRVGNRTDVMLGGQPCEDYDVDTLTREIKELEQTLTQTERQPDSPAKNGRIGKLRMQILVTKSKLDQSRKERDQIAQQAQEVPEGEEAPPPRRMRCTTVHPGVVLSIDGVTYHFRDQVSPCSATLSDGEIRLI